MTSDGHLTAEELLQRFREGDGEALCALVERHEEVLRHRIRRLLPKYLRRRVSIDDILQESRVVALERCHDFEDRGSDAFRNWILGIAEMKARRAVQHHVKVRKRAAGKEVTRARRPETRDFAAQVLTPSQAAMNVELAQRTREALASLPDDYLEVIRLARDEQLPLNEVARRIGRSHDATRKLYGRALVRLGKELRARGGISRG